MAKRGVEDSERKYRPPSERPLTSWVPYRGVHIDRPWRGPENEKPWDRVVTVVIPHLDTSELLDTCIEAWRLQTVPVNILIVDTGSSSRHLGVLDEWERLAPDVEVHRLRFKAVIHPSDPVAIAMDLAFSLCTTKFLFATHADCFPARRDLIEWMMEEARDNEAPVAGYEITPREGLETEGWVGHTATLFDMNVMDELGIGWSQRRLCRITGMDHEGNNRTSGYPDTEFLVNELSDRLGVKRHIVGKEENFVTTDDENIIHVRSYASSKLYSPDHHEKASTDMADALARTHERIERWGRSDRPEMKEDE